MVLWVFEENMVGKWTNESCSGVDEVVNTFWVLTTLPGLLLRLLLEILLGLSL